MSYIIDRTISCQNSNEAGNKLNEVINKIRITGDFIEQINKIENYLKICKDDDKYFITRELAFYIRVLQSVESERKEKIIERIRDLLGSIHVNESEEMKSIKDIIGGKSPKNE